MATAKITTMTMTTTVAMIHERGSGVGSDVAMRIVVVGADPSVMGAGGVRAVMWGSFVGVLGVHTCWIAATGDVARLWVACWPSCVWQTSGCRFYSYDGARGGGSERGECRAVVEGGDGADVAVLLMELVTRAWYTGLSRSKPLLSRFGQLGSKSRAEFLAQDPEPSQS